MNFSSDGEDDYDSETNEGEGEDLNAAELLLKRATKQIDNLFEKDRNFVGQLHDEMEKIRSNAESPLPPVPYEWMSEARQFSASD